MKSSLIVVALFCLFFHASSLYGINRQFLSACGFNISYTKEVIESISTYSHPAATEPLLGSHLADESGRTFDAEIFLGLIKNKRLAIMGDSVALQMFHSLENDLLCEESYKHDGNGSFLFVPPASVKKLRTKKLWPGKNHWYSAVRHYQRFNATIMWCVDDLLTTISDLQFYEYCGKKTATSDVIVIGVGAHFKPLYLNSKVANLSYYDDMADMAVKFKEAIHEYRKHVSALNPTAHVFWRLFPHVSNHDERVWLARTHNPPLPYNYRLDKITRNHSDIKEEAPWVKRYNKVIVDAAAEFQDPMLDWNRFSHQVLAHYVPQNIHPHADATHWCAGGFHRLANLLLQDSFSKTLKHMPRR